MMIDAGRTRARVGWSASASTMMMIALGCGPTAQGPVVIGAIGPTGCPGTDDVLAAGYGDFADGQYGAPEAGWFVELGWRAVDAADWAPGLGDRAGTLEPGQLSGFQLAAAALDNPQTVKIYSIEYPDGCEGRVTGAYGVEFEAPAPFVVAYAVVEGCSYGGSDTFHRGVAVADQGPSTCKYATPISLGSWHEEDLPAEVPPPPAPWDQQAASDCADCTVLWSLATVPRVEPVISSFTVAWLPPDFETCDGAEGDHGIYTLTPDGAPALVDGTDGFSLSGVLHDDGVAKLVLVRNASTYKTLPVEGGVVQPSEVERGRPVQEEDGEYVGLTEYCGP